jgi:hypothetical protein
MRFVAVTDCGARADPEDLLIPELATRTKQTVPSAFNPFHLRTCSLVTAGSADTPRTTGRRTRVPVRSAIPLFDLWKHCCKSLDAIHCTVKTELQVHDAEVSEVPEVSVEKGCGHQQKQGSTSDFRTPAIIGASVWHLAATFRRTYPRHLETSAKVQTLAVSSCPSDATASRRLISSDLHRCVRAWPSSEPFLPTFRMTLRLPTQVLRNDGPPGQRQPDILPDPTSSCDCHSIPISGSTSGLPAQPQPQSHCSSEPSFSCMQCNRS